MALPFHVVTRYLSSSRAMAAAIKNVTVIGGGLMGSGIAQVKTIIFLSVWVIYFWKCETVCLFLSELFKNLLPLSN